MNAMQPCGRCQARQLQCNRASPCENCQQERARCTPARKVRFRSEPRARKSYDFAPDQKWLAPRASRRLKYVSMNPESNRPDRSGNPGEQDRRHEHRSTALAVKADNQSPRNAVHSVSRGEAQRQLPSQTRSKYPFGPLHGLPDSTTDTAYLALEEACLMRHFVNNLASWFDISDRDRHFALVVPERAIFCPILRYAVYTSSAGHLTRLHSCRGNASDVIVFDNIPLPGLDSDSAIRYHNICISFLIEISNNTEEQYNEDVLTAATILRFYEQIDAPSAGPSETYLNAIKFIINSQHNESFYSYQAIREPPRDNDVHAAPSVSLRHSACLIALRQEIWSALLSQRPFRLPVSPNNDYSVFDPANDFIWTNRIFVWVAGLLSLCFGNGSMTPEQNTQRWMALKDVEQQWEAHKPSPFKPIYYCEADPENNRYFPEIWHLNSCQVAGVQHIELGRILLAVSDPTRVSRLGVGAVSRNLELEAELRSITRRICGLSLSNPKCPVAMVTAAVGISVCGEYFVDPGEQEALVKLLENLEYRHGWPSETTIRAMRAAWANSPWPT